MYLPRPVLFLLGFIYLLFLVSADWLSSPDGDWYRPFLLGFLVVLVAAWIHRHQDADEL